MDNSHTVNPVRADTIHNRIRQARYITSSCIIARGITTIHNRTQRVPWCRLCRNTPGYNSERDTDLPPRRGGGGGWFPHIIAVIAEGGCRPQMGTEVSETLLELTERRVHRHLSHVAR